MDAWQQFGDPRFALRFRYPETTPGGHVVDRLEEERDGVLRVHLISRDSPEVYFEVRRYSNLAPSDEYTRHTADLSQRFARDNFAVTGLQATELAGRPALSYTFQWDQKTRVVVLAPEPAAHGSRRQSASSGPDPWESWRCVPCR